MRPKRNISLLMRITDWETNRRPASWRAIVVLIAFAVGPNSFAGELPSRSSQPVDFVRDVLPIFVQSCWECHGPRKQRSGFRLDFRQAALKGGDLGPAILPGQSAASPLVRYVAGLEEGLRMPPEGKPLSAEQIGILRKWIDDGADWPAAVAGDDVLARREWWSLRPLTGSPVPQIDAKDRAWVKTPIDQFIIARLRLAGLSPSPEADRRTLIRRLTFDLHGLPPTPDEVQRFLADESADAYERLVERLLASPRYGERWARHWLDVAHYADSHGQDQDRPRPNAWPYRDYLIRTFNADQDYSQFVMEQVAGDVLFPGNPTAIIATGFLAAGPWDESTLRDIREDSLDRLNGQYLDRDDMVVTTMSSFVGLTVGCARCHDHKFDPISQEEYYGLQAVFAGIDKAERSYDADPAVTKRRADLRRELDEVRARVGKPATELLTAERQAEVAEFATTRTNAEQQWSVLEPTNWQAKQGSILKALLDRSILAVGSRPDKDTYIVTGESALPQVTALRIEVLTDETLPLQGPGRQDNGNLHLSEIRVKVHPRGKPDQGVPVPVRFAAADFDQAGWDISRSLDGNPATAWGIHPAVGQPHEAVLEFTQPISFSDGAVFTVELDQLHGTGHLIGRFRLSVTSASPFTRNILPIPSSMKELLAVPADKRSDLLRAELARWLWEKRVERELAALPAPQRVYCGTNQFLADGSFRPVAKPRAIHVLARGDVQRPGKLAIPSALSAVTGPNPEFKLLDSHREGERRAALARWLADPANSLTWRVIVNRVWHYHFGRGIVETPSDFGRMGAPPSHPELLDWLAAEFRGRGGSLKELHRLVVTSAVYRQSSQNQLHAAAMDGDNRLLWRMNRGRLDAESIRDAVLLVSDRLDESMYGPPVMQFMMKPGIHVTPQADYEGIDIDSPQIRRRSVYRFVFRTRPDPLLDVLDCPDASQAAPVRMTSVSPLQALSLWNNRFTLRHAEHLAELARAAGGEFPSQVEFVSQRVFGRMPLDSEQTAWVQFARRNGLANLCRVLLNSSEFLFID